MHFGLLIGSNVGRVTNRRLHQRVTQFLNFSKLSLPFSERAGRRDGSSAAVREAESETRIPYPSLRDTKIFMSEEEDKTD